MGVITVKSYVGQEQQKERKRGVCLTHLALP